MIILVFANTNVVRPALPCPALPPTGPNEMTPHRHAASQDHRTITHPTVPPRLFRFVSLALLVGNKRVWRQVADLGILSLSRGAPALTSLDLSGCTGVTDAGIAHLSSMVVAAATAATAAGSAGGGGGGGGPGRLECLRLNGLMGLSDDGLDVLLADDGTGGITGGGGGPSSASSLAARAAAARFAATAPGAAAGSGAADAPAPPAAGGPSSRLRVLSLSGCRGVTDAGLARIGACVPLRASLRELDVSNTSATEAGVTRLLDPSSASQAASAGGGAVVGARVVRLRLESLVLPARGRGLSGVGLGALTTGLTSLLGLDLEGCGGPGVTPQALSGGCFRWLWLFLAVVVVVAGGWWWWWWRWRGVEFSLKKRVLTSPPPCPLVAMFDARGAPAKPRARRMKRVCSCDCSWYHRERPACHG